MCDDFIPVRGANGIEAEIYVLGKDLFQIHDRDARLCVKLSLSELRQYLRVKYNGNLPNDIYELRNKTLDNL